MADKDGDEVELTIADEAVVTKYKTAGEIANRKWFFVRRFHLVQDARTSGTRACNRPGPCPV